MKAVITPLLLIALSLFSGCAITPVDVNYDPETVGKIRDYKCFAIDTREQRAQYQDASFGPIVDSRIANELSTALKLRGYTDECAKPDFRVTYATKTTTVTRATNDMGMVVTPSKSPYSKFGGRSATNIEQYEQGTFILYIVDEPTQEVVWSAIYQEIKRWEPATDEQVRKILIDMLAKLPTD